MVNGHLISLNTVFFIAAGLLVSFNCKAQLANPQFAIGGGTGLSTAYAGADFAKENSAFYVDFSYYPVKYGNNAFFRLQVQDGTFVGNAEPNFADKNFKAFTSQYKSVTLTAQIYLGKFYDAGDNSFLTFLRNFYGGVGLGMTFGSINNISIPQPTEEVHTTNALPTLVGTGGYEVCLITDEFGQPKLKVNFSTGIYWVVTRGLDGYYAPLGNSTDVYTYFAIGIKYVMVFRKTRVRSYNKLQ